MCACAKRRQRAGKTNSRKWGISMSLDVRLFVGCALWECENVKRVCVQIIITSSSMLVAVDQLAFWVGPTCCIRRVRCALYVFRERVWCAWCAGVWPTANYDCLLHPIFSCRFEHVLNFLGPTTKIERY